MNPIPQGPISQAELKTLENIGKVTPKNGKYSVIIQRSLQVWKLNNFEKAMWSIAQHSDKLKKLFFNIDTTQSAQKLQDMKSRIISSNPESKNDLTPIYNKAVANFNKINHTKLELIQDPNLPSYLSTINLLDSNEEKLEWIEKIPDQDKKDTVLNDLLNKSNNPQITLDILKKIKDATKINQKKLESLVFETSFSTEVNLLEELAKNSNLCRFSPLVKQAAQKYTIEYLYNRLGAPSKEFNDLIENLFKVNKDTPSNILKELKNIKETFELTTDKKQITQLKVNLALRIFQAEKSVDRLAKEDFEAIYSLLEAVVETQAFNPMGIASAIKESIPTPITRTQYIQISSLCDHLIESERTNNSVGARYLEKGHDGKDHLGQHTLRGVYQKLNDNLEETDRTILRSRFQSCPWILETLIPK